MIENTYMFFQDLIRNFAFFEEHTLDQTIAC